MKHTRNSGQPLYKNFLSQTLSADVLQLFQVFEAEYTSPTLLNTSDHHQGCFLLFFSNGQGRLFSSSREIPLETDDLVLCSATEEYSVESTNPDQPIRCVGIHFLVVDKLYAATQATLELFFADALEPRIAKQTRAIHEVFSLLLTELCTLHPSPLMIRGFVSQIMVLAYRAFSSHLSMNDPEETTLNAVGHTVYAIIRYVDENLFSIHNLMGMAEELGYSYNYLSHLFRRKTGMTIQTYVSRKKIEKSVELLSDEQLSITEIAAMLNYDCIQSFSKAFRRSMDMSPTEYRALHGLKNI